MEVDFKRLDEQVERELNELTKQTSLSADDLEKMLKATCYLAQSKELRGMGDSSYGMSHTNSVHYPMPPYDGISYERGRSPVTGRYVSRGGDHYDYGYSSHSIADRMVAALEAMYDDAKTAHEKEVVNFWISKIRHGE